MSLPCSSRNTYSRLPISGNNIAKANTIIAFCQIVKVVPTIMERMIHWNWPESKLL